MSPSLTYRISYGGLIHFAHIARNSDKPSGIEGFPQRAWNIEIVLLNEHGEEVPATVYEKAVYKLHPSFDKRAVQSIPLAFPFP